MKKKMLKVLSSALISLSLFSVPVSANTWNQTNDEYKMWFLVDDNGMDYDCGWSFENGKWYYIQGQGFAAQGLKTIDGKDYYFDNINCDMKHDQYVKVGYGKYGMWYWTNSDGSIDYNYSWLPGGI